MDPNRMKERQEVIKKIDCLIRASEIFVENIDQGKNYKEMDQSPLDSKNERNLGVTPEFIAIYQNLLKKNTILNTDVPLHHQTINPT